MTKKTTTRRGKVKEIEKKYPEIPSMLSTRELAWFFPVNERTIGKKIQTGVIRRVGEKFPTAETLKALIAFYRKPKSLKSKIDRKKLQRLEFDLDIKKQNYIPRAEVETANAKIYSMIAERINEMPATLAVLISPESPEEAEEIIRKYSIKTLEDLCAGIESEFKMELKEDAELSEEEDEDEEDDED